MIDLIDELEGLGLETFRMIHDGPGRYVWISSNITGSGGLTITRSAGANTAGHSSASTSPNFVLSGSNSFTGVTTVNGGAGGTDLLIGNPA